ncbi:MAG: 6-phosphogluconolactonase (cycloisomerase 2 family) [Planctomycetota bacterium]
MSVPKITLSSLLAIATCVSALFYASCGHSGGAAGLGAGTVPGDGGGSDPDEFSYPKQLFLLGVNETLETQAPVIVGSFDNFSVTPALPDGLTFDTETGEFSGTVTTYTPSRAYSFVASTGQDEDLVEILAFITISVTGESRFGFSASALDGSVSAFGIGGSDGVPFHQGYNGEAINGFGQLLGNQTGRVLCGLNETELTSYVINQTSGIPNLGFIEEMGTGPHAIAMHPSGLYVFVTTALENRIRSFSIDAETGEFILITDASTAVEPISVICDPNGRYLIVEHEFGNSGGDDKTRLRCYTIDQETGEILQSATFDLVTIVPAEMVLGPHGENLYLTLVEPFETVLHCTVDPLIGRPALAGTEDSGQGPTSLAIDPGGRWLYVSNLGSEEITLFEIDQETGSPNVLSTTPASANISGLSMSDDGRELYVVDSVLGHLTVHQVDQVSGEIGAGTTLRTRIGNGPLVITSGASGIRRRSTDLYVLNEGSGDVTSYRITAETGEIDDGLANVVPNSSAPRDIVIDPHGRFAYVSDPVANSVTQYSLGEDGSMTELGAPAVFAAGEPGLMAIDPSGRFALIAVGNFDLLISYSIAEDGTFTFAHSRPLPLDIESITFDPTGQFFYVAVPGDGITQFGEIGAYSIDSSNGLMIILPSIPAAGHPSSLEFNPTGTRAYVTFEDSDSIIGYDLGVDGALLAISQGSIAQPGPKDIELTRDGRFAYSVFGGSVPRQSGLLLYDVEPTSGELFNAITQAFQWRDSIAAGEGARRVEVTPSGEYIYVLTQGGQNEAAELRAFSGTSEDGFPTAIDTAMPGVLPVEMEIRDIVEDVPQPSPKKKL